MEIRCPNGMEYICSGVSKVKTYHFYEVNKPLADSTSAVKNIPRNGFLADKYLMYYIYFA